MKSPARNGSSITCRIVFSALGLVGSAAWAQGQPGTASQHFELPAQDLAHALISFANQTEVSLLVADGCRQIRSPMVRGTFTTDQALRQLLAGSGCTYRYDGSQTLVIRPSPPPTARPVPETPSTH